MKPGQLTHGPAKLLLLKRYDHYRPAVGVAVLDLQPAGRAVRNTETILQNTNGSGAAFRTQKFPSANSLSMALSN
jgi:hypothetical protein